jgi:outer membrane protein
MNNSLRGRTAVALLTLALAAGCVDQKKEVALYQKQLDALPGSAPPGPDDSPLSLQQALRLAEKNDESLGLSGETYVQALIAKDRAFSAFLPQISVGPSYSIVQKLRGEVGPTHSYGIPLAASINVFNGFRDEATLEQNDATVAQTREQLLNEQQLILLDVGEAYYTVLQNERSVLVYRSSLAEQDERVRQAKAEYQFGNGTPLAVAQSESTASATRVQFIQAEASVTTSRAALGFLLGIPMETRPLTDQYIPPREMEWPVETWLADADVHRQDLIASASAVEAARQAVRIAIGEYFPSITLSGNYPMSNSAFPWTGPLSGIVQANIPIFTGGQIESDVRTAFSQLRAAVLTQSQTRKQVEDDIRTGYANLQSARDQVSELRVELAASRDALVLAQRQFNVGLAINLDILTAQDQLLSTQLQLATQEYQEKINYLNLLRVAGHLTFADAAPTTLPSTEPSDLETTTPNVIQSTTEPSP